MKLPAPSVLVTPVAQSWKRAIPDPDVQGIEISKAYASLAVSDKMIPQNGCFGKAMTERAAANTKAGISEHVIGEFIGRVKMRVRAVPGLVDGDICRPCAVQGEAVKPGISRAVEPKHCPVRGACPADNGCSRICTNHRNINAVVYFQGMGDAVGTAGQKQGGGCAAAGGSVERRLQRLGVICHPVAFSTKTRFGIKPAWKRSGKFIFYRSRRLACLSRCIEGVQDAQQQGSATGSD